MKAAAPSAPSAAAATAAALVALGLALLGAPRVQAATATAQATASVVEAVPVTAWLAVPVDVQTLVVAVETPADPATGSVVARLPGPSLPAAPRLPTLRLSAALDAHDSFGIDAVTPPAAALLPHGLAAAVTVAATEAGGDGSSPLVIIVAFN